MCVCVCLLGEGNIEITHRKEGFNLTDKPDAKD